MPKTKKRPARKDPPNAHLANPNAPPPFDWREAAEREVTVAQMRKAPNVPVKTFLLEAHRIAHAALEYRSTFTGLPISMVLIDTLLPRVDALRKAEHRWSRRRLRRVNGTRQLFRREAQLLKREGIAALRFLMRQDAHIQAQLAHIAAGDGLADFVDDLERLADLLRSYARYLGAAQFPRGMTAIDVGHRLAELAQHLANDAAVERSDASAAEALADRNACYWLVAGALREIRAAAAYAFRNAPDKLTLFRLDYSAAKKRRSRARRSDSPGASDASSDVGRP